VSGTETNQRRHSTTLVELKATNNGRFVLSTFRLGVGNTLILTAWRLCQSIEISAVTRLVACYMSALPTNALTVT